MSKQSETKVTFKYVLIAFVKIAAIAIMLVSVYFAANGYSSLPEAKDYLEGSDSVAVSKNRNEIFFDGNGEDALFIFYGGALVDEKSYNKLAYRLAETGVDTVIVRMPFDFAIADYNKADSIRKKHPYNSYYIGGHSLGGTFCTVNASKNSDVYDGVVLLGSYCTGDLSGTKLRLLSIYGENDLVLNMKSYDNARVKNPSDTTEYVIKGGNHAAYGQYGIQDGDGSLSIDPDYQIEETVTQIADFILK